MHREKKRNKIIIFVLLGVMCIMGAGYAAFQTQIQITGVGNISGNWSVKITNVEVTEEHNGGTNKNFTFKDTTAELEADLYNKGDYVIYTITVANEGDFDAKLETLGLEQSTNDAVLITSEGLVKGQTLLKKESTKFTVKIEYNSNYSGDATGTSGMADLTLDFVQNSGGTIIPTEDYLVTYDYTTNGGTSTNAENAYLAEGEAVNLNYVAAKENAEFLGWNTNSQAEEGLIGLSMPNKNITLYAIFKDIDTTPPTITNISTSSTINSITLVTTATEEDGEIDTYEYSINDGNWIKISGTNSYTFTGLKSNTEYSIKVRVRNKGNTYSEQTVTVTTKQLNKPTFVESETGTGKTITIIYPEGEGLTYEYQKDSGNWTTASQKQEVEFTESGTLVAKVSDGTNSESATYTVELPQAGVEGIINKVELVNSGDGLYKDNYEENVYTYKGTNPNNYIVFNGEIWKIISLNTSDNTIKIVRNEMLNNFKYDDSEDRFAYSDYCNYRESWYGCNIWGSSSTLYDVNMNKITSLGRRYNDSTKYQLPASEATLNIYLNNDYYNSELNATARSMVESNAIYKAGLVYGYSSNINTDVSQASAVKWKGKVALIDATEYVRASTNSNCLGINTSSTYCKKENWMYNGDYNWWTMSPFSGSPTINVLTVNAWNNSHDFSYEKAYNTAFYVRPVVTLSSKVKVVVGNGSPETPFIITL